MVQVDSVISPAITKRDIKLKGKAELITFSSPPPHLRSMHLLKEPTKILGNVLAAIRIVFPQCSNIVVKMLTSEPGDVAQLTHTDYVPEKDPVTQLLLRAYHYSALISIEPNTRLLTSENRDEIDIPLHSMVLWRGDMLHAGAAYENRNSRLFISASSEARPATTDVQLHYAK